MLKAFVRIAIFSLCAWAVVLGVWHWQQCRQEEKANDPRWKVEKIAHRSLTEDRLPSGVLSELLELQADNPLSLFAIQPKKMKRLLEGYPPIKQARIIRLLPSTLSIEYTLRKPVALIAGVKNVALDEMGKAIFLYPFFSPKRLPRIILPHHSCESLESLQRELSSMKETAVALDLLSLLEPIAESCHFVVDIVDTSRLTHENFFRREIVVALLPQSGKKKTLYLRLCPHTISQSLSHLSSLFDHLPLPFASSCIIDLRYPCFALLKKVEKN
jgi:hypothetical protein